MTRWHYSDVIMSMKASQISGVSIVSSTVCSGADQRKHQNSASLHGICDGTTSDRWIPVTVSGHNGHKPKRPKAKRPQTEMTTNLKATNRNGHKLNGHKSSNINFLHKVEVVLIFLPILYSFLPIAFMFFSLYVCYYGALPFVSGLGLLII